MKITSIFWFVFYLVGLITQTVGIEVRSEPTKILGGIFSMVSRTIAHIVVIYYAWKAWF